MPPRCSSGSRTPMSGLKWCSRTCLIRRRGSSHGSRPNGLAASAPGTRLAAISIRGGAVQELLCAADPCGRLRHEEQAECDRWCTCPVGSAGRLAWRSPPAQGTLTLEGAMTRCRRVLRLLGEAEPEPAQSPRLRGPSGEREHRTSETLGCHPLTGRMRKLWAMWQRPMFWSAPRLPTGARWSR